MTSTYAWQRNRVVVALALTCRPILPLTGSSLSMILLSLYHTLTLDRNYKNTSTDMGYQKFRIN